jgi:deoxyribodipyrimidine photo-lyase
MTFKPTIEDTEFEFRKEEIEFVKQENPRARFKFQGGEDTALKIMKEYLGESGRVTGYKYRPKSHIDSTFSSRLSPWLANGSLSIRKLFHEAR